MGKQRAGVRGQAPEVGGQKSEAGDQGLTTDPASNLLEVPGESLPAADPVPNEETQDENAETDSSAVVAVIQEAFSSSGEGAEGDAAQSPPPTASKRVEVLFRGRLGPKLLTRGDITDDPAYVALLGDRRGLVREVVE